jgi:hypothetical protein
MTDTAPSAVEPCCEYEWNEDAPIGRYPVRFIRCNGAAWRAQSSEHEAERRRLEQAVLMAAQRQMRRLPAAERRLAEARVDNHGGDLWDFAEALVDILASQRGLNAFLDAERAVEES